MATVKVKYRPSSQRGKEGTVYYQIIHKRVIRQIKTEHRILREEWEEFQSEGIPAVHGQKAFPDSVRDHMAWDMKRLKEIIGKWENSGDRFTADDIVREYREAVNGQSFSRFMEKATARLKQLGREQTAANYATTLNSFMRFRNGSDVGLDRISSDLMMEYEAYLKGNGIAMNTVSFYMRILRAVYNRAVEKGLTEQRHPFQHVYTGVGKTEKRAVSMKEIKRIKDLDLSMKLSLEFARDMFLFSFYTRGMSFVDMAYLKKADLKNDILSYRRKKTRQQLFIKWEKQMEEIVRRHPTGRTDYLLPIIKTAGDERRQYRNALRLVNNKLKEIAAMAGLQANLTMYVSRHSWASIAKSKNVPVSVISEGLGHDSETTTQIYLSSLDCSMIDKANEKILRNL